MATETNVWFDKPAYDAAECRYFEKLAKGSSNTSLPKISLAGEVAKARQHIKNSLQCVDNVAVKAAKVEEADRVFEEQLASKLALMEKEKLSFLNKLSEITANMMKLEMRVQAIESKCSGCDGLAGNAKTMVTQLGADIARDRAALDALTAKKTDDDDDGVDLFGSDSDEESEEAQKIKEARVQAYAAKKSKKPVLIAKSNIILDVKPWDDETDMKKLEAAVREIKCDGLLWGASKLVPLAYGIHKLQISCVVEDDKVSIDWLQETIEANEDFVQSVDIAAFNKV